MVEETKIDFSQIKPKHTKLFINGNFVDSISGKTFGTFNPATEEKIAEVSEAQAEDVDIAVKAARKAFEGGPWREMAASDRGRIIYKLADLIEKNLDEIAALESIDNGKPFSIAKGDIALAVKTYRYYAGWADKIHGKVVPMGGPYLCYTREEPVGVVAQVIPWNYPVLMQSWKMAPALATGCTLVLKPAEQTPLTALYIANLSIEAGFPPGVINVLPGFGLSAGAPLCQHQGVDKIVFTGSTEVGYEIMRNSHKKNLKRITLELGGKSAIVIMDDADIDSAVQQAHSAIFGNMGQSCIAASRTFVHESIYDEFIKKSVLLADALAQKIGDPFSEATEHGPQIDQTQYQKIMDHIVLAQKEGAQLKYGGKRRGDKGWFIEPTVIADVEDHMVIAKEEVFGPVLTIFKFKTLDEAIERANNSQYGLGAGIVTKNMGSALKFQNSVKAGTVYVNCYDVQDANTPFGGFKDSGMGRELGEDGLRGYLEIKTVITSKPEDCLP